MDTTEKQIRDLFVTVGEFDRDEVAMLLLQLVERIQNLERTPQRTWVGLDNDDLIWIYSNSDKIGQAISNTETKLREKNQ